MITKVIERDQLRTNVGKRGKSLKRKQNKQQTKRPDILKEEVTAMTGAGVSAMLG